MYRKLISNLAFSPSTIEQVSFYARRLKQEESVRRLGFVLILISMCIQLFAALAPPEKSVAASRNDVIYGGVTNIDDLRSKYNSNADVRALYNRFGLGSGDLTRAGASKVNFNFQQQGDRGTKTVGRINFSNTNDRNLGSFAGSTFYSRSASEWQGSTNAFYFGKRKGTDGRWFYVWVLKDCGNIAFRPTTGPSATVKPVPKPPVKDILKPGPAPVVPITPVTTPPPETSPESPPEIPTPPNIKAVKSVRNITQNLSSELTNKTPARGGDIIEYTLRVTNTGESPFRNYTIEDNIDDILDYATLDTGYLSAQGGQFTGGHTVSWPDQTIPAKGKVEKTFRVTVKETVPSTNTPNATAPEFDCRMQNGFGSSEVTVMVECPVLKTVEELPNTGPGTTVAIMVSVSVLAGYFFMRNRLLSKEVGIIKRSYQSGTF